MIDKMDPKELEELFLQGNANKEYIAQRFAEVFRALIRAAAAYHGKTASDTVRRAAMDMQEVSKLLQRCQEPIKWYDLFSAAVEQVRDWPERDVLDKRIIEAARLGMAVISEASARDGLGQARLSKRESEFLSAIERLERERNGATRSSS